MKYFSELTKDEFKQIVASNEVIRKDFTSYVINDYIEELKMDLDCFNKNLVNFQFDYDKMSVQIVLAKNFEENDDLIYECIKWSSEGLETLQSEFEEIYKRCEASRGTCAHRINLLNLIKTFADSVIGVVLDSLKESVECLEYGHVDLFAEEKIPCYIDLYEDRLYDEETETCYNPM